MNVEHQSVLTYKDHIDAQLLLMLSGPLMELDRTREMSQQQKVIFKNKFIISNRKGIKAREIRIFRIVLIREFSSCGPSFRSVDPLYRPGIQNGIDILVR